MKFFLILFFLPTIVFAQNLRVVDGDTIHIGKIKYRFHGIDAPEMSQICKQNNKNIKCGVLSKVKLVEKINNQKVKEAYRRKNMIYWTGRLICQRKIEEELRNCLLELIIIDFMKIQFDLAS